VHHEGVVYFVYPHQNGDKLDDLTRKFSLSPIAGLATVFVCSTLLIAGPARATDGATTANHFVSHDCEVQVKAIAARASVSPTQELAMCSGTVTVSESPVRTASISDIAAYAATEHLSSAQTQNLIKSASAASIYYRSWTHTYFSGAVYEVHSGRTYWNGSRAWISSYLGFAGSHACHAQGSWAVGWAVTPISCANPGVGASADAYYRFDESVAFRGSIITLGVGLHYSTSASGAVSAWQVGG
jgi:hypothetical protein